MSQNLVEKITQRHAVGVEGQEVKSGDFVSVRPAHVMTHDNTGAVMLKFKSIGARRISVPRQPVFTLDHNVQDTSEANMAKYAAIESFAREMGVDFYPALRGIGHQIMVEEGYAFPLRMVVASDSHSNMYGGLGCLGTPVVRTDAAALWATSRTWWQVPPVARVFLNGALQPGVTGKDVIITLCGLFNQDEVLNHAVEFLGEGVTRLTIEQRLTIANMTTEWGALAGVFPVDDTTITWLRERYRFIAERGLAGVPSDADGNGSHPRLNRERINQLEARIDSPDPGAYYAKTLTLDLSSVRPHVSGPNHVKVMASVSEMEERNVPIQKAYLVSCVNSRLDDLADAARVVRGQKVADHVEFYIAAASSEVQGQAERLGYWQTLIESGARVLPPGCGPCIGLGAGLLQDGEVGISATNRNFKGRMGSREAEVYLASPAVVAASAIAGWIRGPVQFGPERPVGSVEKHPRPAAKQSVRILPGFPASIEGELIFCNQDNLNTDGIYPGKYTYIDDFTAAQQASVVMENYDPKFKEIVQEGDILVGGYNFGTGSSREQAATALKYRGIPLVLAGTLSETYKRNALNNGFLVLELPELVEDLRTAFPARGGSVRTGWKARLDFGGAVLTAGNRTYTIGPVGEAAQELIIEGGLESWTRKHLD